MYKLIFKHPDVAEVDLEVHPYVTVKHEAALLVSMVILKIQTVSFIFK